MGVHATNNTHAVHNDWRDAEMVVAGRRCAYAVRPGLPSGSTPTAASALLAEQAAKHLDLFDAKADNLRALARWTVARKA